MSKEQKLALMKYRLAKLDGMPKNIKAPGVTKALKREIRNLEKTI